MNTPRLIPSLTRLAAMVAAGTLLAAGSALAHGHHDHGSDRGSDHQMKSRNSGRDRSDKHSLREVRKDKSARSDKHKDREAKRAEKKQERDAKHAEKKAEREAKRAEKQAQKEAKRAEKMKEKEAKQAEKTADKDKTTGTTTTTGTSTTTTTGTATTADGDLFGKGIAGRKGLDGQANAGSATPGSVTGPGAGNTVHPIPGSAAAAAGPAPVTAVGGGLVRDKLPDGTVYVRRGTSAELAAAGPTGSGRGIVTVTDNKGNSFIIPDHGGGVAVTPAGPEKVTISNGANSRTVFANDVTISGATAVAVDKSLGTGPRRADGSVNVFTPSGTVTGGPDLDAIRGLGNTIKSVGKAIGRGAKEAIIDLGGMEADALGIDDKYDGSKFPPLPSQTSTVHQQ